MQVRHGFGHDLGHRRPGHATAGHRARAEPREPAPGHWPPRLVLQHAKMTLTYVSALTTQKIIFLLFFSLFYE